MEFSRPTIFGLYMPLKHFKGSEKGENVSLGDLKFTVLLPLPMMNIMSVAWLFQITVNKSKHQQLEMFATFT